MFEYYGKKMNFCGCYNCKDIFVRIQFRGMNKDWISRKIIQI
jgi:hypothetical protein